MTKPKVLISDKMDPNAAKIFKERGCDVDVITGKTPDGKFVEIAEIPDHPWFVAVQFHPEFKSRPLAPHPLFAGFVRASLENRRGRARRVLTIAGDRYAIELPPDGRPEEVLRELTGLGATMVSLNPLRETLEDVFVRRVAEMGEGARPSAKP